MAVFHYLVKNDEGARSEGDIRAESMDLALQKLTSNGQIVITLKEVDTTFDFLGPFLDEINLTFERLKNHKREITIMHPGPMNRGVEIDSGVADSDQAIILDQVLNGVASRMSILYCLCGGHSDEMEQNEY